MRGRWLQGFALGVLSGAVLDFAGPLAIAPAAVATWYVLRGDLKLAGGSGAAAGAGLGLLVPLLPNAVICSSDAACGSQNLSAWIGAAVGFMILGVGLALAANPNLAVRGLRDDPAPGRPPRPASEADPPAR